MNKTGQPFDNVFLVEDSNNMSDVEFAIALEFIRAAMSSNTENSQYSVVMNDEPLFEGSDYNNQLGTYQRKKSNIVLSNAVQFASAMFIRSDAIRRLFLVIKSKPDLETHIESTKLQETTTIIGVGIGLSLDMLVPVCSLGHAFNQSDVVIKKYFSKVPSHQIQSQVDVQDTSVEEVLVSAKRENTNKLPDVLEFTNFHPSLRDCCGDTAFTLCSDLINKDIVSPAPTLTPKPDMTNAKEIQVQASSRFIFKEESNQSTRALSPLVLLQNENPKEFKESVKIGLGDKLDELFFEANIPYAEVCFHNSIKQKNHQLKKEEVLAIYFYSAEWNKGVHIYTQLNTALCSANRNTEAPKWKYYLFYLLEGLRKIPKWKATQDLYRGVPIDLVREYPSKYQKDTEITWYSLSSTTTHLESITAFLSPNGPGTIFVINNSFSGRPIQSFSAFPEEFEILLPPGSRFKIIGIATLGPFQMIQLSQIPTLEIQLKME